MKTHPQQKVILLKDIEDTFISRYLFQYEPFVKTLKKNSMLSLETRMESNLDKAIIGALQDEATHGVPSMCGIYLPIWLNYFMLAENDRPGGPSEIDLSALSSALNSISRHQVQGHEGEAHLSPERLHQLLSMSGSGDYLLNCDLLVVLNSQSNGRITSKSDRGLGLLLENSHDLELFLKWIENTVIALKSIDRTASHLELSGDNSYLKSFVGGAPEMQALMIFLQGNCVTGSYRKSESFLNGLVQFQESINNLNKQDRGEILRGIFFQGENIVLDQFQELVNLPVKESCLSSNSTKARSLLVDYLLEDAKNEARNLELPLEWYLGLKGSRLLEAKEKLNG